MWTEYTTPHRHWQFYLASSPIFLRMAWKRGWSRLTAEQRWAKVAETVAPHESPATEVNPWRRGYRAWFALSLFDSVLI